MPTAGSCLLRLLTRSSSWFALARCCARRSGRQRTEYYSGMDLYITDNTAQMSYTIVPTGKDVTSCFDAPGAAAPVPLLPANTTGFVFNGTDTVRERAANRYVLTTVNYGRVGVYTLWVAATDNFTPIRYEMMGYDTLLGSHFDKYVVEYEGVAFGPASGANSSALYKPLSSFTCKPMSNSDSDGNAVTGGMGNPLAVLADAMFPSMVPEDPDCSSPSLHPSAVLRCEYEAFAARHASSRGANGLGRFRRSAHFVEARNRASRAQAGSFRVALNRFADWTDAEMLAARGGVSRRDLPANDPRRRTVNAASPTRIGPHSVHTASADVSVPAFKNWTAEGAVLPPPDQAICGSCWAHGAAATIAGSIFRKTGKLVPHSRQELMDCSWAQGNNACDGGFDTSGYEWILTQRVQGLAVQSAYGPYLGQDGRCHNDTSSFGVMATIAHYREVQSGSEQALLQALTDVGPISISIDAALPDFTFYSSGVYDNPACKNDPDDLDHTVLAAGFGTDAATGKDYYLVRNSWSTHWGDNGYIRIARQGNICGVATQPTYVVLN